MNVGQLKKLLDGYPDDATVMTYADHGQTLETAYQVCWAHVLWDDGEYVDVIDDDADIDQPPEGEDCQLIVVIKS